MNPPTPEYLFAELNKYVQCNCHEAYTERGLIGPDCQYHDIVDFMNDVILPECLNIFTTISEDRWQNLTKEIVRFGEVYRRSTGFDCDTWFVSAVFFRQMLVRLGWVSAV